MVTLLELVVFVPFMAIFEVDPTTTMFYIPIVFEFVIVLP